MSFEHPYLFFMLFVPFFAFAYLVLTNKDGVERVFSKDVLERIKVEGGGLSNRVRNILFFVSIFMMIIAVSHPYILKGDKNIKLEGLSVIVALDISNSMRSKDMYPNRLNFAKLKIKTLLEQMPEDEMTILTFNDKTYLVSPSTTDKETLKEVVNAIVDGHISGGSDFTTLAYALKERLANKKDKIVIIVSDGGSGDELKEFKRIILQNNIRVFAILTASKNGAPILDIRNKAILKNDKVIMSSLDLTLGKIAEKSGGNYIVADYKEKDIIKLASKLRKDFIKRDGGKSIHVVDRVDLFYYPLIIAFLLLIGALSSFPKDSIFAFKFKLPKLRRKR